MGGISLPLFRLARFWRRLLRRVPAAAAVVLVWVFSLLLFLFPALPPVLFSPILLSCLLLSRLAEKEGRLFRAALFFLLFWILLRLLLGRILEEDGAFYPARLGCFVFLGLHLFFVWTPLELARACLLLLRPLAGARVAALCAVSVTALIKIVPVTLQDAVFLKRSLERRARGLSFGRRLSLWSRALIALSFGRAEDLSRALDQRQRRILQ
ncbi:MAG: hypothetical protein LBR53_04310 [Deltaproteobacteria bacterium]|jgi:hypothetical protein|nr:hypothetical protein [Deltaproteobacteria bacterium]